jgi:hypothetical protein
MDGGEQRERNSKCSFSTVIGISDNQEAGVREQDVRGAAEGEEGLKGRNSQKGKI